MEYSLWLTPEQHSPAGRFLRKVIDTIAIENGRRAFFPHVTLVGAIEGAMGDLKEKTNAIAALLTPYEIRFDGICFSPSYFRNMYLQVSKSREVMEANAVALRSLGIDRKKYAPHCSLVYGDLREQEIVTLRTTLIAEGILEISFPVTVIELWQTEGRVEDWRRVHASPFNTTRMGK